MRNFWEAGEAMALLIRLGSSDGGVRGHLPLPPTANLGFSLTLAAGLSLSLDLARPWEWKKIRVETGDEQSHPLLIALLGRREAERMRREQDEELSIEGSDLESAKPWLRVATVDALNRWLQLPLDQTLVEAEQGLTRWRAAQGLPEGPLRDHMVSKALGLARAAAYGVVSYLDRLGRVPGEVPEVLSRALASLVSGYRSLADEIATPDEDLESVLLAWERLEAESADPARVTDRDRAFEGWPSWPDPGDDEQAGWSRGIMASRADPRQFPARLVKLAGDPLMGEIFLRARLLGGQDAVEVEVPAYDSPPVDVAASGASERLQVRLIDQTTGALRSQALLTLESRADVGAGDRKGFVFRGVLPLRGLTPAAARADVFDSLSKVAPARTEADADLLAVRRAVLFLSRWRRLAAVVRLGLAGDDAGDRLRSLTGDPTASLDELGNGGVRPASLSAAAAGRRAAAVGVGRLLVAEIAAAHEATLPARQH